VIELTNAPVRTSKADDVAARDIPQSTWLSLTLLSWEV